MMNRGIVQRMAHLVGHYTCYLMHWGRDNMAAMFQTTFSNAFSWINIYEFRLRSHKSLFLWAQLSDKLVHFLNFVFTMWPSLEKHICNVSLQCNICRSGEWYMWYMRWHIWVTYCSKVYIYVVFISDSFWIMAWCCSLTHYQWKRYVP